MSKSAKDDFAAFAGLGGQQSPSPPPTNGNGEYYDEYEEEMDFEPQNGYHEEVMPQAPAKKAKSERGREALKVPSVDLKGKFASMKKPRMPSPYELKESYLNSKFHNQFKQPLAVRTRIEDVEVQKARQLLTQSKSPSELGNLKHPLDIPLPKMKRSAKMENGTDGDEVEFDPKVKEGSRMYNTLPRSWRTQNLVTSTREITDLDELARRKQLIESKSPAELANITSLADFPVPTKIKRIMSPSERIIAAQKRTRSNDRGDQDAPDDAEKENEPFSIYATLPRSMRETKILTNTREIADEDELNRRRELVLSRSPTQLSEIHGLGDFPVPTRVERLLKRPESRATNASETASATAPKNFSETMYATLPKSWKEQNLITQVKTDQDPEIIAMRRELTQTKTPAELAQISSMADLPIPTALENFLKSSKSSGGAGEGEEKQSSKPITKMNLEDMYNTLPRSLKAEVLVGSKVMDDPEKIQARQELVKSKTPKELSVISGLDDFPLPTKIETLVRKNRRGSKASSKEALSKSKSWSELRDINAWRNALPDSMKAEVLVRSRIEDPEVQLQRAELTKNKTVQELSQINSLAEFPIPKTLEALLNKEKAVVTEKPSDSEEKPLKDKLYDTLPRSMKSEVLVRVRDENPDIQKQRQELTRAKSPVELSKINSLAEFPIPKNIEGLLQKKPGDESGPTPPPRRFKKEDIYATLPASFKTEVLVKTKIETDEEVLRYRQELARSKTPTELSEIHGVDDFPIPTFVQNLAKKASNKESPAMMTNGHDLATLKGLYDSLPSSMKSEVLVRARQEAPEVQQARAELVKQKNPNQLSQINNLDEFPLPKTVEQWMGRAPRPVERRKKFRALQRSQSANIQQRVQEALPESLKTQVLVKARIEDPEILNARREIVQSKSVSELSQMASFSDFPIPTTIEKLMAKSAKSDISAISSPTSFDINKIYDTLPSSMKSEVMVRSRIEDPEILAQRREVCQSKSVSELSRMETLSDFPIPTTIEKLIEARRTGGVAKSPTEISLDPKHFQENIYATLPRSLKSEVLVRTRVEEPGVLEQRRNVVQSKSVSELAQVNTLADFPLPTPIEHLIQGGLRMPKPELGASSEGGGSGSYDIYASLPRSLKKEVLVRSKVEEDENVLKERQSIVRSKTPAELSQIHSFAEVPLPRRIESWLHHEDGKSLSGRSSSLAVPKNAQEMKDIVYNKFLPEALTRPVVVRSKTEDPEVLRYRQELQQSKSIHELSKIRNVNELPLPAKVQPLLPDLPLPSIKGVIGMIARVPQRKKSKTELVQDTDLGYTPASTPHIPHDSAYTDDEMLRFEMSSPESMVHREQDFDYEVIEAGGNNPYGFMQTQVPVAETPSHMDEIEDSSISVADHYKGTPPLRSKKKGKRPMSHEIPSDFQGADETTPPASISISAVEPSRPERRNSKDGGKISRTPSGRGGSAASGFTKLAKSSSSASATTMGSMAEQFHSVRSTLTRNTDDDTLHTCLDTSLADTLVGSEDLHSCADTLNDQYGSDDEYFGEMLPRDRNSRHLDDD